MTESVSRESSTSADVDRYEYSSLSGPNDIRCLILKSGSGSEPLSCQLRHIKLGEGVPFEAISYVWGSRVMDYNILCDSRRVDITANLHHSLRQTRLSTRDRVLWADSICINQDNNEEKGHQVRLMGRIYSQAKRVLITLGQDERSNLYSKSAASAIRETSSRVLQTLATLDGGWNSFPFTENDDPLLSDPRWLAIEQLTAHPWFKRGWVIQEAALATEAFILWGHEEITWFEFMRMYSWSFLRARKIHHEYKFVVSGLHLGLYGLRFPNESTSYLRQESPYMRHSLDVLQASRELELDDDKDHVYAFLALPQTAGLKNLQISYDKTASDVYRDVAIWYAEKEKELLFLHYVENNENDLDSDYPSWIPQWHYCRYTVVPNQRDNSYITSHVSGDVFAQVIQSKILQTRGLTFDAIAFTSQTFSGDTTLDELGSVWVSISQYRHRWAYPGSYLFTAFFNTIVAGLIPPDINNASLDAHVRAIMPRLTGGVALPDEPGLDLEQALAESGKVEEMHQHILNTTRNRRVVVTERGYIGLVPGIAEVGDICGVIFGTKTPFILRSTASDGHYKLVGEAFIATSRKLNDDDGGVSPCHMGAGEDGTEDWLKWGLEEQDIFLL